MEKIVMVIELVEIHYDKLKSRMSHNILYEQQNIFDEWFFFRDKLFYLPFLCFIWLKVLEIIAVSCQRLFPLEPRKTFQM
jgi:hypothetical protein